MSEANKQLTRRWFEEVWNKGRADAIDEMLSPNAVVHGLSDDSTVPLRGPEDFKPFHRRFRDAFPGLTVSVDDLVAEGDKVTARCSVRGIHEGDSLGFDATQAEVEFDGIAIVRIEDGMIVEAWNNFDFMKMYQQVGAISRLA
jgi:steroid delta-isomerase-like uncharacterized protein